MLELADDCDLIHQPRHDPDGYNNFELFCCRDLNDHATAEHLIKIDADVLVAPNWIDYVMEGLARAPDAVLFGPGEGSEINVSVGGAMAEQLFGRELRVENGRKVMGYFYVAKTEFFRQHNRLMKLAHELFYCFDDGVRRLPSPYPKLWPRPPESFAEKFVVSTSTNGLRSSEDVLRNFVANAAGAADRIRVLPDTAGRIIRPHPGVKGPR